MLTGNATVHETPEPVRRWLISFAERLGLGVNGLTLDAIKVEGRLQVVCLDNAAGTIQRLSVDDEKTIYGQVEGLLEEEQARTVTINASHIRVGHLSDR